MHFENGLQRQPNIQTLLVNRDFMLIFQSAVLKMYKIILIHDCCPANRAIANLLGCSMDGLKSCLEKKSVTEILKAQKNLTSSITNGRPFLPVVDHKFLYGEFDSVINNCF